MCRVAGYFDLNEIAYAVFETSGELSILPRSDCRPATTGDMNVKTEKARLILPFVIDGMIFDDALKRADKSREWLLENLGDTDVKRVLLACYDPLKDDLSVKIKNTEKFADIAK